jgi:CO/xanthine dehydrogenase Mo-binding subunit/aerobic-type carbon monoxide dehydrogenase small subunit (CoxS/CutS family)
MIDIFVNGKHYQVRAAPEMPLLYILRHDLGLKGPKTACAQEQCGACNVLVDGAAVPSCQLEVQAVQGLAITTIEGLGTPERLHPLQEAFMETQAVQCGYCVPGMVISAQGLLNRRRYPTDEEIREALAGNLCRCGVHERVRRAIRLRIGRPVRPPLYEMKDGPGGSRTADPDRLPEPLQRYPDLDSWFKINPDGTITLLTGKVEYGQGLRTALAQIAAEELDVAIDCIQVVMGDTDQTPDEGFTVGSRSLETTGRAVRQAAAEARQHLLSIAFEELEAPRERLMVTNGTITDPATGRSTTYWELSGGKKFGVQVTGSRMAKVPDAYRIVGQPAKRTDLLAKVTGAGVFIQDIDLPGLVYGRVVRPPGVHARLVEVAVKEVSQIPGVLKVVRDGNFLGVIAEREAEAIWAAEQLRDAARWDVQEELPLQERLYDYLTTQPTQSFPIVAGQAEAGPVPPIEVPERAAATLTATYTKPYHMHASLAPSAAAAQMVAGRLTVWAHTQGAFPIRASLAHVLGMAEADIRVIHVEGSGCYGHTGADDAALDAALLARAVPGKPVLLKWSRADEHGWEPYGPAAVSRMQASLDDGGGVLDWNHDFWSYPHSGRDKACGQTSNLVAAWHLQSPMPATPRQPAMWTHGGAHRNADPLYRFPRSRIVKHFAADSPLRVSSFRSLGAYANIFAIESFMDELAHAAGEDPVAFRLRYLEDARARAVLTAAAEKAGWEAKPWDELAARGRGVAFAQYKNTACYAAVVVDVRVERASGQIHLARAVLAADAGQIVNPDGLSNQLEGGFNQGASMTLVEKVTFDRSGVTSQDWETYPILKFPDIPTIETVLLNQPGQPYLGSGEGTIGPTPAAIANAVFDAVGIRLRQIPFTPEAVLEALNG